MFRSKSKFGLGLTSVTTHFVTMQVIRCSLLKHSVDPDIRTLYRLQALKEQGFKTVWRASKVVSAAEAETTLDLLFPSQDGRRGLGAGNFNAHPTLADKRKMSVAFVKDRSDDTPTSLMLLNLPCKVHGLAGTILRNLSTFRGRT